MMSEKFFSSAVMKVFVLLNGTEKTVDAAPSPPPPLIRENLSIVVVGDCLNVGKRVPWNSAGTLKLCVVGEKESTLSPHE